MALGGGEAAPVANARSLAAPRAVARAATHPARTAAGWALVLAQAWVLAQVGEGYLIRGGAFRPFFLAVYPRLFTVALLGLGVDFLLSGRERLTGGALPRRLGVLALTLVPLVVLAAIFSAFRVETPAFFLRLYPLALHGYVVHY